MPTEKYSNSAQTTLNGTITSGATTLVVTSATLFPTSPRFRILIDSEILLVTAVSGTTFTVTRGVESTTAAAHTTGATVTHVLTGTGLESLAERFVPMPRGSEVSSADYAWTNQGTATLTENTNAGAFTLVAPASAGGVRIFQRSLPAAPYTATALVWYLGLGGSPCCGGIYLRESSSGKFTGIGLLESGSLELQKWTNPTTFSALYAGSFSNWQRYINPVYLRLRDDNTNRFYEISADGSHYETINTGTITRTDFLTPDQFAFAINPEGTGRSRLLSAFSLTFT